MSLSPLIPVVLTIQERDKVIKVKSPLMGWKLTLLAMLFTTVSASAAETIDDWPARPIKVIVPYTPGGSTDVAARVVMDKLSQRLKQSIIVENRPGANGNVGATLAARSDPDGYTFAVSYTHLTLPTNREV